MGTGSRIVPVEDLPDSLWSGATLQIPPTLANAYRAEVRSAGLEDLAHRRDSKRPPVGGPTKQAADEHFAQAFDGSVARAELALLDPKSEVVQVADALAVACAGGRLAILDVPCGAGALFLSLLCSVGELRARGVVPRMPLDVVVVGGELNVHASAYAVGLHARVRKNLEEQAIWVTFKNVEWDVLDKVSTTDLLKLFVIDAKDTDRKLVAVSNFSNFLVSSGKQKKAGPQLDEIFRYCGGRNSVAVWLEPQTNAATEGLFPWLRKYIKEQLQRVASLVGLERGPEAQATSEAHFALPLQPGASGTVRLAVLRFDLQAGRS